MPSRLSITLFLGVVAVPAAILVGALVAGWPPVSASHVHVGNQGERFRLPWLEGVSHNASRGQNDCSVQPCHGVGEVDFSLASLEGVKAIGDGTVADLSDRTDTCAGRYIKIAHTDTSYASRYLHLAPFSVHVGDQVQQGKTIAPADTSGTCQTGAHLHFDMNGAQWPAEKISQTTADMWSTTDHIATSNNPGAGYWGTGGANEAPVFRDRYLSGGAWPMRGSTSRMETYWEVCNSTGGARVIFSCPSQFGDIHAQSFRGTTGDWRMAMVNPFRGGDGAVHWLTRGFFAAYTDQYDSSRVWSYWLGAPTGEELTLSSDIMQQNFEGGYTMIWVKSLCQVGIYRYGVGQHFRQTATSCDNGGGGPGPGFGDTGD